ncbi:ATP-binding protein [Streptomyces jumonjinensis]|uniref:ATP-binding protein n=1 Tax=Streptomyces jumonjinensis TaxID=1945 RepID=UPI00379BCACC
MDRTTEPGAPLSRQDQSRPAQIRRIGRAHLRRWRLDEIVAEVELLLSETVTNAFQHGRGPVGVRLVYGDTHVRIEVTSDPATSPLRQRRAAPLDESGRGLELVAAFADAWGVLPDNTGVWCTLTAPKGGRPG